MSYYVPRRLDKRTLHAGVGDDVDEGSIGDVVGTLGDDGAAGIRMPPALELRRSVSTAPASSLARDAARRDALRRAAHACARRRQGTVAGAGTPTATAAKATAKAGARVAVEGMAGITAAGTQPDRHASTAVQRHHEETPPALARALRHLSRDSDAEAERRHRALSMPREYTPQELAAAAASPWQSRVAHLPGPGPYAFPHAVAAAASFSAGPDGTATQLTARASALPWEASVGVATSEEGAGGVAFLELPGCSAIVVKRARSVLAEAAAARVASAMHVTAPAAVAVATDSSLGRRVVAAVRRVEQAPSTKDLPPVMAEYAESRRLSSRLAPMCLLMEYVRGTTLDRVVTMDAPKRAAWVRRFLGETVVVRSNDSDAGRLRCVLHEAGKTFLHAVGEITALDIALNNDDRLPVMWDDRRGNLGNLMVTMDSGVTDSGAARCVVAIDSSVMPHDTPEESAAYADKCRALLAELEADTRAPAERVERVRWLMLYGGLAPADEEQVQRLLRGARAHDVGLRDAPAAGLGFDIGEDGVYYLQRGILAGMRRFREAFPDRSGLDGIKIELSALLSSASASSLADSLHPIVAPGRRERRLRRWGLEDIEWKWHGALM